MKGMVSVALLCTSFPCFSGWGYEMAMCRNGAFPEYPGQYSVAKITAPRGDKVHFYSDDEREGCPDNKRLCQYETSLRAGDNVLVAQEKTAGPACGILAKIRICQLGGVNLS